MVRSSAAPLLVAFLVCALVGAGPGPAAADAGSGIPPLDASSFDPATWRGLPGASVERIDATLAPGVDTYHVRVAPDGTATILAGPLPGVAAAALPGDSVALCTPRSLGIHYTTTLDQQEGCPLTWHDGAIDQTVLVCVVAGDCTIAGQDAATRGTFWVICHGKSGTVHAWGVLPAASVQCESGTIGATPQTWTHWNSWCRVFGLASGMGLCAHAYG